MESPYRGTADGRDNQLQNRANCGRFKPGTTDGEATESGDTQRLIEILRGRYANETETGSRQFWMNLWRSRVITAKHAIRVLGAKTGANQPPRIGKRIYDEAVLSALIVGTHRSWEAAERICGKRFESVAAALIGAMERDGFLQLAGEQIPR